MVYACSLNQLSYKDARFTHMVRRRYIEGGDIPIPPGVLRSSSTEGPTVLLAPDRGTVCMIRCAVDRSTSRFRIALNSDSELQSNTIVIGRVISGLRVRLASFTLYTDP